MTCNATLFARLNELRVAADLAPLKSYKGSRAQLEALIAKLEPVADVIDLADWCRANGKNPKVVRAKCRRHLPAPADGWKMTKEVRALLKA